MLYLSVIFVVKIFRFTHYSRSKGTVYTLYRMLVQAELSEITDLGVSVALRLNRALSWNCI